MTLSCSTRTSVPENGEGPDTIARRGVVGISCPGIDQAHSGVQLGNGAVVNNNVEATPNQVVG
jgi:hypothetical protein